MLCLFAHKLEIELALHRKSANYADVEAGEPKWQQTAT
jgi:hypothetical protein